MTGWTVVSGNTFSDRNVTDRNEWGWGGPFNTTGVIPGKYHLWGIRPGDVDDAGTGELHSQNIILGGDGQIDFLIGGGMDPDKLYIALVRASDGIELMKATGNNYEMYHRKFWDASAYIGDELYIKVVDQSTGSWGHINIDDVNVPMKLEISIDGLFSRVQELVESGKLIRSEEQQLINKLKQAKDHMTKGNKKQAMKYVEDFMKLLDNSDVGGQTKNRHYRHMR